MTTYILRRVIYSFILLILSATLIFFIVHATPGSPYARMINEMVERWSPQRLSAIPNSHWERLDALLALDQPVYVRYLNWLKGIGTGNMGVSWSIAPGQSTVAMVVARLPYSLALILPTVLLSILIAAPLGLYSAARRYTNSEFLITILTFLGVAMPTFWIGMLLIGIFSSDLRLLPFGGVAGQDMPGDLIDVLSRWVTFGTANPELAGSETLVFVDGVKHLILPVITLSILLVARWSRMMRASTLEVLGQDYIRTAHAKGVRWFGLTFKHVLRNSLIPLITMMTLDIPMLLTGSFMVEIVFSWPGLGRLYIDSLRVGDWPLLVALLVGYAYMIIMAMLAADMVYMLVDPRIRFAHWKAE
jgi:peptide/nickel transport system permease protein